MLGPRDTSPLDADGGGVNGRNPSRLPDGTDPRFTASGARMVDRGVSTFDPPMFGRPTPVPVVPGPVDRGLLPALGGVNGRKPPRLPPCTDAGGLPAVRFPTVPASLPPNVPAPGFM